MKIRDPFEWNILGLVLTCCVLCVTAAAMLLLSTDADNRKNEKSDYAVITYYEADLEAEKIYAKLQAGETVPGVTEKDGVYSYCCPISEGKVLAVEVQHKGGRWSVLRWDVEETGATE
ncbi:MAG: hypothetical protein IJB59_06755 [Oscillospiraceae bacterium]|nr:hypothetical protein [Oscillospiraceae bacterium]